MDPWLEMKQRIIAISLFIFFGMSSISSPKVSVVDPSYDQNFQYRPSNSLKVCFKFPLLLALLLPFPPFLFSSFFLFALEEESLGTSSTHLILVFSSI
jgi:hypothetical protein